MSEVKDIKPFKQIPTCDPDTVLSILGAEYEAIQNFLGAFRGPLNVIDNIFNRNLNEGNIVIKYVQEDGTEITKEEAVLYIEQAKEHLKERTEELEKIIKE